MSDVASWLAAIEAHAQAAGAALDDPMTDVAIGFPWPRGRCARVFWNGEAAPETMGGRLTLDSEMVAEIIRVTAFWPVGDGNEEAAKSLVTEMATFVHELRTRVLGDASIAAGLAMEHVVPTDLVIGGTRYALAPVDFVLDYIEYPQAT